MTIMASATQPPPSPEKSSEKAATQPMMDDIEKAIDYQFNNKALLQLALTTAGANEDSLGNNKTLARIGQGAIQVVVARVGFEKAASQGRQKLSMSPKALFGSNTLHRMD
jgi:dsRNA-specific ribonuclease